MEDWGKSEQKGGNWRTWRGVSKNRRKRKEIERKEGTDLWKTKVGVVGKGKGSITVDQKRKEKDKGGKERQETWRRSFTRRLREGKARRKREDGNGGNVGKKHGGNVG